MISPGLIDSCTGRSTPTRSVTLTPAPSTQCASGATKRPPPTAPITPMPPNGTTLSSGLDGAGVLACTSLIAGKFHCSLFLLKPTTCIIPPHNRARRPIQTAVSSSASRAFFGPSNSTAPSTRFPKQKSCPTWMSSRRGFSCSPNRSSAPSARGASTRSRE